MLTLTQSRCPIWTVAQTFSASMRRACRLSEISDGSSSPDYVPTLPVPSSGVLPQRLACLPFVREGRSLRRRFVLRNPLMIHTDNVQDFLQSVEKYASLNETILTRTNIAIGSSRATSNSTRQQPMRNTIKPNVAHCEAFLHGVAFQTTEEALMGYTDSACTSIFAPLDAGPMDSRRKEGHRSLRCAHGQHVQGGTYASAYDQLVIVLAEADNLAGTGRSDHPDLGMKPFLAIDVHCWLLPQLKSRSVFAAGSRYGDVRLRLQWKLRPNDTGSDAFFPFVTRRNACRSVLAVADRSASPFTNRRHAESDDAGRLVSAVVTCDYPGPKAKMTEKQHHTDINKYIRAEPTSRQSTTCESHIAIAYIAVSMSSEVDRSWTVADSEG